MHRFTIALISLFAVMPAFGNARLPVVNVAAGSVSARAAFGESVARPAQTPAAAPKKRVIARAAKQVVPTPGGASVKNARPLTVDAGEKIASVNNNDVLIPRRPSADLWAHSGDAPLRMPRPNEFTVMRSDAALPEESLDSTLRNSVVAHSDISEIDTQIARLNELQRRADDNVRAETTANVAPRKPSNIVRAPIDTPAPVAAAPAPVKISQLVVPMERDVVERTVARSASPRIATVRNDMTKMSPNELRRAFRKTFLSENKHLSTFQIDDAFDVASDMSTSTGEFISRRDLSETGGIRPLEIKIRFRNDDSALSRDNYNLLTEYAGIVLSNPTRAIQISIPQNVTTTINGRKLAARRLAIIEQVLRDTGISQHRIMPVLTTRDDPGFMLRMISNEQYDTLTQQKRNMFGDMVQNTTQKSLTW